MTTRRRLPTAERRQQIAEAALRLLAGGRSALTTAALAKAVGVTTGAIFRHFPDLDAVWTAAVERAVERLEQTFPAAEEPPLARLRGLLEARVRLLREEPGMAWLLRSGQATGALPPAGVRALEGIVKRSRAYLRKALVEGAQGGEVRDDLPPEVLLVPLTASVHALAGAAGVHGRVTRRAPVSPARVIDGLLLLLAPGD